MSAPAEPQRICLVTGSRDLSTDLWQQRVAAEIAPFDVVIHGNARGIDTLAHRAARRQGKREEAMTPSWETLGKQAGPLRNRAMLQNLLGYQEMGCEIAVLAFHDSLATSKGTKHMVAIAQEAGVSVTIFDRARPA